MKFSWMIGGEAGYGIMTTGLAFSRIASRSGYSVFDYIEYPSLIRGGHNAFEACVSDEKVTSLKTDIDFLVCLNKQTFELHKHRLRPESVIVYDHEEFEFDGNYQRASVPFKRILKTTGGEAIMRNTIALGASLALLKADRELLYEFIETQFAKKGDKVIEFNKKFAKQGYEYVVSHFQDQQKPLLSKKESISSRLVMTGNDAFSMGSVLADCRMYASYPMTPSSSVLSTLAAWQKKTGLVVRHAEDEISVINTALGASFAGVRSAIGTSGGGFALMVESLSYAGIAEIPIVVFLSQRPGPATGMPTWTEQGDLLFAVHAGHGEFPKIVLAPGDVTETIELTLKAFNLADIYQTPIIVMSDMLLSESHGTILHEALQKLVAEHKIDRGKTMDQYTEDQYLRYKLTSDGISPRLIPGVKGYFYQANSYEHVEDGHTTEESLPRIQQVEKRNKKSDTYIQTHFEGPRIYGETHNAELVFVAWGSTKGAVLEAQKQLEKGGCKSAFIHFTHLYPLSKETITGLFKDIKSRTVLIENNSTAQFGKLLRQETGIDLMNNIFLKYDGRPFMPEEIVKYVREKLLVKQ